MWDETWRVWILLYKFWVSDHFETTSFLVSNRLVTIVVDCQAQLNSYYRFFGFEVADNIHVRQLYLPLDSLWKKRRMILTGMKQFPTRRKFVERSLRRRRSNRRWWRKMSSPNWASMWNLTKALLRCVVVVVVLTCQRLLVIDGHGERASWKLGYLFLAIFWDRFFFWTFSESLLTRAYSELSDVFFYGKASFYKVRVVTKVNNRLLEKLYGCWSKINLHFCAPTITW